MIILYRYLKKKHDARKAAEEAPAAASNVPATQARRSGDGARTDPHAPASEYVATVSQTGAPDQRDPSVAQSQAQDADTPLITKKTEGQEHSTVWMALLMLALALPVFLETLDYTVVATAQVHIASVFNRLDLQSYIGTIYLLTSTVFLPPFASIANIFGRHWALQVAIFFFMVGSAISTGAHNMPTMLAGRGIAGIGAAGLLAVVRIILADSGSIDSVAWQQLILFGLYTVGYCVGPFIGGELLKVSFRWIFAINLPCCFVAMILAYLVLRTRTKGPEPLSIDTDADLPGAVHPTSRTQRFLDNLLRIDWIGMILFMAGGILLLLALNWGSTDKWRSARVIVCFILGGLLLIASLAWEYFLEHQGDALPSATAPLKPRLFRVEPMIALNVFTDRNICIAQFGSFVNGMVMLVMFYFVAIFFVVVAGESASKSGAQLIYFAPGMAGGSITARQLLRMTKQPKWPIMLGSVVCAVALGLISWGMDQNKNGAINGFMAMAGVGTGLSVGPIAVQARFSQPIERNAVVSALTLFFRSFGGTIGLAQCGAVLNGKASSYLADLVKSGAIAGSDAAAIASMSTGAGLTSIENIDALPAAVQASVREAFRVGTRYAFVSLVPWAALAAVLALFLTNIPAERPTAEETKAKEGAAGGETMEMGTVQHGSPV